MPKGYNGTKRLGTPTLNHAAHLSPPPSLRLATSIFVLQHPHKVRMRPTATGGGKWVRSLEQLVAFSESPKFICEWSLRLQPKVTAILRDQVCISQKGDVGQNILLFRLKLIFHFLSIISLSYSYFTCYTTMYVFSIQYV